MRGCERYPNENIKKLVNTPEGFFWDDSDYKFYGYWNVRSNFRDLITFWGNTKDHKKIHYSVTKTQNGFKKGKWLIEGRIKNGLLEGWVEPFYRYEFGYDELEEVVDYFGLFISMNKMKTLKTEVKYDRS